MTRHEVPRRFVPPLGWPFQLRAVTITPGKRHPLVCLNRYPRQVIGIAFRLPDADRPGRPGNHRALSILWAKPARWWKR